MLEDQLEQLIYLLFDVTFTFITFTSVAHRHQQHFIVLSLPFHSIPYFLPSPQPISSLSINLLMRKPLARLQILLLKRRIQHAQTPYLARARRVVARDVRFGFAVCSLEGEGTCGL